MFFYRGNNIVNKDIGNDIATGITCTSVPNDDNMGQSIQERT